MLERVLYMSGADARKRSYLAALLLATMVWLGVSLVTHTISEEHIQNHIANHVAGVQNVGGDTELCILTVVSHTPIDNSPTTVVIAKICHEEQLTTPRTIAVVTSDHTHGPSLRAPPYLFS